MKNLLSRIWFPAAVVAMTAAATMTPQADFSEAGLSSFPGRAMAPDTVVYPVDGYKRLWTEEDFKMDAADIELDSLMLDSLYVSDSLGFSEDSLGLLNPEDTLPPVLFRDTVKVPDSLKFTDPFRYKYYAAIVDSATHQWVRDTLRAAGDTLDWIKIDSIYYADSTIRAELKFLEWYNSLSKEERKKYDFEQKMNLKMARMDEQRAAKEERQFRKDSILSNTPRILESGYIPDSLYYKRIISWTVGQEFHDMQFKQLDTGFNYRFHDYPFLRNDVNATWLGVAGSPVQTLNFLKRKSRDKVSFYEAQESWSWTPATLPMYNTKTPYTELAYFGTLFSGSAKESDNLHLMTTQNINPEWNFALGFDRYGGAGILLNENTINKNVFANVNHTGKRHLLHAGYIHNMVSRQENGGVSETTWIRDTTVDAKEIAVALSGSTSRTDKKTFFLDQQYKIPFTFLNQLKYNRLDKQAAKHFKDSVAANGLTFIEERMQAYVNKVHASRDTSADIDNVTTAFIGHSSEISIYSRKYQDKIAASSRGNEKDFFGGNFYYNPNTTADSIGVTRLDNKVFIRLQPWSEEAVVSRLDVGIGDRLLKYYNFDPTFTRKLSSTNWNSAYLYAGAKGVFRNALRWDALGEYVVAGKEFSDFNISANAGLELYPFRKMRHSPLTADVHFETSLDEPDFYQQHLFTNHYKWDNDFGKVSRTEISGVIAVPAWDIKAEAGFTLLANNLYCDTLGIIRQNTDPMTILTASLEKNFHLGIMHFDHRALFQLSSNQEVVPLPQLALNLRYYAQLDIEKGIMQMQIGLDGYWNTLWYTPGWNPETGMFYNQRKEQYHNGPYIDAFINAQWKRACLFVKLENAGMGIIGDKQDYFSAHHYINTQRQLKIGLYWPFYTQPNRKGSSSSSSLSHNH